MTIAKRDQNQVTTMLGVLNTDGVTITPLEANPSSNLLSALDNNTGSDFGQSVSERDPNRVPTLIAASSSDGTTPVQLYVDSSGNLLIDST